MTDTTQQDHSALLATALTLSEALPYMRRFAGKTFVIKHRIAHADGTEALEGFERRILVVRDPDSARGIRAIEMPEDMRARLGG